MFLLIYNFSQQYLKAVGFASETGDGVETSLTVITED